MPEKKTKKTIIISNVKLKKKSKRITGKLSVKYASVKIKIGNKGYKWATVRGEKFYLDCAKKIKKGGKITIVVTAYNCKKCKKVMKIY